MTLYVVTCEYDFGFNFNGYSGVYSSEINRDNALANIDLAEIGLDSLEALEEESLLYLSTIEG